MAGKFTFAEVDFPPLPEPPKPSKSETVEKVIPIRNPLEIPSSKPERQLLNLIPDVFTLILRAIFLKQDGNVKLECSWRPDGILYTKSLFVGPKGLVSMLRTCKKVRDEGLRILYGENTFECYHVRVLKNHFIHGPYYGIGKENAARIRNVQFGLPLVIRRANQEDSHHAHFLDLLCTDLPGLHKLTIKTHMIQLVPTSDTAGDSNQRGQTEVIQALIATAARTTKYHPILRKVIYRQASGEKKASARRTKTASSRQMLTVPLSKSIDIVLNTKLIRQTPWRQIYKWNKVANFELLPVHDEATGLDKPIWTSEVDKSELATWPGQLEYDPVLELKPDDQVAMVRANHGKYLREGFVMGDIVDGRFVRGKWLDTGFVQGIDIAPRLVDGRFVPEQFVQGRWVSDNEFIEGRFVDGAFVPGMWVREDFVQGRWLGGLFTKGKWEGENFTEGLIVGNTFYVGTWRGRTFLRGSWAKQPAIPELLRID
ncbi:hypothetical protein H2200_006869 [Cladophialophora chaetospira]|uniref:Uncharacterized protein n=1 Tax=Cladophialophora chaetospira TaxID=386627 RepID=A0AA38X913_9EURO|nr:hypothetical protein H2200_006869 [Cladophialophora chaetospira]